jgi:hypothetical protein
VQRLVVSDFLAGGEAQSGLTALVKECITKGGVACLIDIGDSRTKARGPYAAQNVYEALRACGVASARIAYLTYGSSRPSGVSAHLERILKEPLVSSEGELLKGWWHRMRGAIDYSFFREGTRSESDGWHHPSRLDEFLNNAAFTRFLQDQAGQEYYGVWQWVLRTLVGAPEMSKMDVKRYTYLCGKAFLRCGGSNEEYGVRPFAYTALRALAYGLFTGCPERNGVEVVERPSLLPPVDELDNDNCMKKVFLRGAYFEGFARALKEWLEDLEAEPNGACRPTRVMLLYDPNSGERAEMVVDFTAPLPGPMLDGTGQGLVTASWKVLRSCFGDTPADWPQPALDRKRLTFCFSRPEDP